MSREVPSGWTLRSFGSIATLHKGLAYTASGYTDHESGLPFAGIKVFNKGGGFERSGLKYYEPIDDKRYIARRNELLIANTDLTRNGDIIGSAVRVPDDIESLIFSMDVSLVKVDPNAATPDFIYNLINSDRFRLEMKKRSGGSTVLHLKTKDVPSIDVLLPPLHEQRRIADILSSVDEAIAATRAVIEQTRKVKQGVLERLLTKGIGHTRFKQTEIGEIPEGWKTGRIGDFFTLQRGFDITEKQSTIGEYPVVSSSGISYYHSGAKVHGPAVITGRKGKLGQVHFIDSSCWPHDTTLWVKDFKSNAPKYVYWFLRSLNLEKFDAATAVPTLNRNVVHALTCAFPPISEQLLIADRLDCIEATEVAQTRNLASYGQTKSALMSDLLTGRKRVTDALPMAAE